MTGLAAPPLPAEFDAPLRRMRLPYLRKAAPDVLATARAQRAAQEQAEGISASFAADAGTRPAQPAHALCEAMGWTVPLASSIRDGTLSPLTGPEAARVVAGHLG